MTQNLYNNLNRFKASIDKACRLLDCDKKYEEFILIKIKPLNKLLCCCDHCYVGFWSKINKDDSLLKPISHEGNTIVTINNTNFVLEQHESGPEFIVGIATGIVANAIWSWICNFIKHFLNDPKNKDGVFISIQSIKSDTLEYKTLEIKEPHLIDTNVLIELIK